MSITDKYLLETIAQFKLLFDNLNEGVYCVDDQRRIFYWNKKAEELTGYTKEEIVGETCFTSGLNHKDSTGRELCLSFCPLVATMFDGKDRHEKVTAQCKDLRRIPITVNTYPLYKDGTIIGAIEVFSPREE